MSIHIGVPQAILLTLFGLGLAVNIARHGKTFAGASYSATRSLTVTTIELALLWWGGFFS